MVKNYMETLVDQALQKELTERPAQYAGLCTCPECLAMVRAFALNQLQPFYVTCVAGQVFGEYRNKEVQNLSDILVAVTKGMEAVLRENPHGADEPGHR